MTTRATNRNFRSPRPELNPYQDQGRLNALQVMLCARIDELVNELGITLFRSKRMYYGCCPVHGGDNVGALNLYYDGDTRPGYWRCNTKSCNGRTQNGGFGATILGFVRGVLSQQRHDWTYLDDREMRKRQKTVGWKDTVDWCCAFLGTSIRDIKVDYGELEKRRFVADVAAFTRSPQQEKKGLARSQIRTHLEIPATYFVNRGWSPEVLDRYDVGLYPALYDDNGRPRPLAHRVAVPIYDNDYRYVVGFTGRSVFDKCPKCGRHHHPNEGCPERADRGAWGRTAKWYNHQFNRESYLYNYWFAKKPIRESKVIILVEGPGDLWRLEESGIHNGVAMLGVHLSDEQQVMVEISGAINVVVLTNSDEAGMAARDEIRQRLRRSFRLHFPDLPAKDLGEMRPAAINEALGPLLTRLAERGY